MSYSLNKMQISLAVTGALALGLMSAAVNAQVGWLHDSKGGLVRDSNGNCVHAGPPAFPDGPYECNLNDQTSVVDSVPYVAPKGGPVTKPVVVAAATPVPVFTNQRLVINADVLFDYDSATLRPSGRRTLDTFADTVSALNPQTILAVGHASRPGSQNYNPRLSEARANSVKGYLASRGIAPSRVRACGVGETQPITFSGECLNAMGSKAIACRQPDRHVEIEWIGARILE